MNWNYDLDTLYVLSRDKSCVFIYSYIRLSSKDSVIIPKQKFLMSKHKNIYTLNINDRCIYLGSFRKDYFFYLLYNRIKFKNFNSTKVVYKNGLCLLINNEFEIKNINRYRVGIEIPLRKNDRAKADKMLQSLKTK